MQELFSYVALFVRADSSPSEFLGEGRRTGTRVEGGEGEAGREKITRARVIELRIMWRSNPRHEEGGIKGDGGN